MSRDTLNERKWEEARAIQTRYDATTVPRDRRPPEYGEPRRSSWTSSWSTASGSAGRYGIGGRESAKKYAKRMAKVHKTGNPDAGRGMSGGAITVILAIVCGLIAWVVSAWSTPNRDRIS